MKDASRPPENITNVSDIYIEWKRNISYSDFCDLVDKAYLFGFNLALESRLEPYLLRTINERP